MENQNSPAAQSCNGRQPQVCHLPGWRNQHQGSSKHVQRRVSHKSCQWRSGGEGDALQCRICQHQIEKHSTIRGGGGGIHYRRRTMREWRWGQQWVWWRRRWCWECRRQQCFSHEAAARVLTITIKSEARAKPIGGQDKGSFRMGGIWVRLTGV
jgi:hypothetical protein